MIEPLPGFPETVLAFACRGHVSKRDYDTVLVPEVEKRLARHDKLRIYYEIGADFEGIDPLAVWEDFRVGMAHVLRWERVAVVTDVEWIGHTMAVFGFLIPAEVKVFPMSDAAEARAWIAAPASG